MSEKNLSVRLKQRCDTTANWEANNPVLLKGEIAVVEGTDGSIRFKVGDGSKAFNALAYTDAGLKAEIATKGDKLTAAGGTATPVYIKSNGTAAAVTNISEKLVNWSTITSYKSDGISPLMVAMSPAHAVNRFALCNPEGITIEYSNDNQATWIDYEATNNQKRELVSKTNGTQFYLGKKASSQTINDALRITLSATAMGVYCNLMDLLIQVSTNSKNPFLLKMEYSKIGEPENFIQVGPIFSMGGWSGWNDISTKNSNGMLTAFGGSSNQTNQTHSIRFTFYHNPDEDISKIGVPMVSTIMGFAVSAWRTCSNMGYDNHLYNWDVNQNAVFPANVTATKLIGGWEPSTSAQALTTYTALSSRGATNNLNQSLSRGISYYSSDNATNTPANTKYGTIVNLVNSGEIQNNTDNWLTQIASSTSQGLYYRQKTDGNDFSKWEEIIKIADDDYFVLNGGTSTTVV